MLEKLNPNGFTNWEKKKNQKEKRNILAENEKLITEIEGLQKKLFANKKHSILVVLQGIDASGKNGAMRSVFSNINPLGCRVYSYGKPTKEEYSHDFLWRIHQNTPGKGMIHVFNRSHYEDILVPTVENLFSNDIISRRYDHINNFERMLTDSGVIILKFYLHISKEEQLERLIERVEKKRKHWKHQDDDWETRKKWDRYMEVYEQIFSRCNEVPWHIVPSNRNWIKVNTIAKVLHKTLKDLKLDWPALETEKFNNKVNS
ncbi:PPK2 family polyphosphate kinase [Crocinitomix catalasitica]|uniref:PPK2 family polyphosphate kinase n=1 Tax=Crocinitomix catalasitica TaxID=184607 RepID=UPI0004885349|nr:PPK2 family polyphosphate kinase [Crocinitomix catalasitica]